MIVIKEAIEKVNALAVPNYKELDGKTYCDKTMTEIKPKHGPDPKNLSIKTLSGIVGYIKNKLDDETDYLVHINDFNSVTLYGKYDPEFCRRKMYVDADSQLLRFQYGRFMDVEEFIIYILSYFKPSDTLSNLFAFVGKLSDNTSITLGDDGITQNATVKTGVVSQADKPVPNPIELIPYETFPEIDGVPRKFVFRLKKTSTGVACALFESGDTCWKLEYIQRIKEYFKAELYAGAEPGEALRTSIIA
jgi:hypothetical protein